jgi:PAS domain S-box-containing protein
MKLDRKITVWTTVVVLGAAVVAAGANYHIHMREDVESYRSLGSTAGPIIEASLQNSMMTKDAGVLTETLQRVAAVEPITRIWIINNGGVIKRDTDDKATGAQLSPGDPVCRMCHESGRKGVFLEDKDVFRWVQPVLNRPQCHRCHAPRTMHNGVLILDFSIAKMRERLAENARKEFLAFLPSLLIVGLAVLILMRALVSRRLNTVIEGMRKFKDGDYGARIALTGDDEITRLGEGFNEMSEEISRSQRELKNFTEELLALGASSNVVAAVPRTENIYEAVCHVAVKELKLKMAWIGLLKKGNCEVDPVAQYGFEKGYLSSVSITWDDSPAGRGPTGTAIRAKTPQIMNDLAADPAFAPWRDEAAKRGYRSSMALPFLSSDGDVIGVLNLYSGEAGYFTRKRIRVFMIFANQAVTAIENRSLIEHLEKKNREITQQLKVISRSQKEWQETFDSITDLVTIHDADHTIVRANKAFAQCFNTTPQAVVGRKCHEFFHGSNKPVHSCPLAGALCANEPGTHEFTDDRSGRTYFITIFPMTFPGSENRGIIHIARDVTEEREKEMRLIMSERLASLGQMASGIAHEINNPLASIAGCSEGLLARVRENRYDHGIFEKYLNIIQEEVFRCKTITTSMLSFVRKNTYEKMDVDVKQLLEKTLEIIGFQGRLKRIEVRKDLTRDDVVIRASEGELRQALLVIIINALDAMQDKGILTLATERREESVLVRVSDTGPGIPAELQPRIFDPFFTTKQEKGGTGLGLSIARKIVMNHNGTIDVFSSPEQGTTFTIVLPLS